MGEVFSQTLSDFLDMLSSFWENIVTRILDDTVLTVLISFIVVVLVMRFILVPVIKSKTAMQKPIDEPTIKNRIYKSDNWNK